MYDEGTMVTVDDRSISVQDLAEDLRRLAQLDDRGELIVGLHRLQSRVSALISQESPASIVRRATPAIGALSMTPWLRYRCRSSRWRGRASNKVTSAHPRPIVARTVDEVGSQPNPDYRGQPGQARNVEETLVESDTKLNPLRALGGVQAPQALGEPRRIMRLGDIWFSPSETNHSFRPYGSSGT